MRVRATLAGAVVATLVVAGTLPVVACGGSSGPERDRFVRLLVEESDRTISQATANCIYDRLADDAGLIRALASEEELTREEALRRDEAISACLTGG